MAATANRFHLVRAKGDFLLAQVARDIEQQIALGRLLPGDRLPRERALAAQLGLSRNTVTPGLRLGWIAAPPHMVKQLSLIKMRANLFTEGLLQLALAELLENGTFEEHLLRLQATHTALQRIAVKALRQNFLSDELEFSIPEGGLYIWCRWRRPIDMEAVLLRAQQTGTGVAPGRVFFAGEADDNCFRICFTASSEQDLPEAIRLLAAAFHRAN
jgi:DNA-binding transcriptional MocR family regulator